MKDRVYVPLVPQVDQPDKKYVDKVSEAHQKETGVQIKDWEDRRSFAKANVINSIILKLWELSEDIQKAKLDIPYGILSDPGDEGINISWGFDDKLRGKSTRSCFYMIDNEGEIKCREYPKDEIKSSSDPELAYLSITIISDLLQSWEWDWEQSAKRFADFLKNQKREMEESS